MPALKKNLYIEQGATYRLPFTWHQGTVEVPGPVVDLTGMSARMQVRKSLKSPAVITALSTGLEPRIILGAETGTILITLTDADTQALDFSCGVYDFEIVRPFGQGVDRLLQGKVYVDMNVTREVA